MLKTNKLALSRLIKKKGEEILLYSAYIKARKPELCKVFTKKSKQYSEYVRRGFARCDVSSILTGNLDKLIRKKKQLTTKRELALTQATEALARADCLKKQTVFVQKQINSLSTRVSTELDEEDSVASLAPVALESASVAPSSFPSPRDLFQSLFSENVVGESSYFVGFSLVPMYYLFRRTLFIIL